MPNPVGCPDRPSLSGAPRLGHGVGQMLPPHPSDKHSYENRGHSSGLRALCTPSHRWGRAPSRLVMASWAPDPRPCVRCSRSVVMSTAMVGLPTKVAAVSIAVRVLRSGSSVVLWSALGREDTGKWFVWGWCDLRERG